LKPEIKPDKNKESGSDSNATTTIKNSIISSDDLLEKHKNFKLEFLWQDFIVKNGNNFLTAEGGTGKSRLALSLAFCIQYGYNEFLGCLLNTDGNVLYLNYEITEPMFKVLIEPINKYYKATDLPKVKELFIVTFKGKIKFTIEDVEELIADNNIKFIIIDSFKACASKLYREKNTKFDNLNADLYFDILDSWREKYKITTLTINHTNKGLKNQKTSGDLAFGPSAVRDFMDYQFFLRYATDNKAPERLLILDKTRFTANGDHDKLIRITDDYTGGLYYKLLESGINEDDFINKKPPHEKTDEITDLLNEGKKYDEIVELTGVSRQTISRVQEYRKSLNKIKRNY